jgi:hypothetical protein
MQRFSSSSSTSCAVVSEEDHYRAFHLVVVRPVLATHICGTTQKGRFAVIRHTVRKRWMKKLREVKTELRQHMHDPIPEVGAWLKAVVDGHIRYYGVPGNRYALANFRFAVGAYWHRVLRRRSQTGRVHWGRMKRLIKRWLPPAHIYHPYPSFRLRVRT